MFEESRNLFNLLHEGEEGSGPRIYNYKSIATALYRGLNSFEQSVVVKLLSSQTVQLETLVSQDSESLTKLAEAENTLIKVYKVVEKYRVKVNTPYIYKLNKNFADSIRFFFSFGLQNVFKMHSSKMEKCINNKHSFEKQLTEHAYQGWSDLYHFMLNRVNTGSEKRSLTPNIIETMNTSNLVFSSSGEKEESQFFDFLLNSIRNQVSVFLYSYCKYLFKIKYRYQKEFSDGNEAVSEGSILNLLFNLTLLLPMMSFSIKESEENLRQLQIPKNLVDDILTDLNSIGLIKIKTQNNGKKVTAFAITPLIHNVLNGTSPLEKEFKHNIIVETDFKIYAYSHDMNYLESLLELFCVIKCKFPNLVICSIREDRMIEAFNRGITPNQILKYLNSNAHFKVIEKKLPRMSEEDIKDIS